MKAFTTMKTSQPPAAPPSGTSSIQSGSEKQPLYSGLTPYQLTKLACLIAKDGRVSAHEAVDRAVEFWNAANIKLGVSRLETLEEKLRVTGLDAQKAFSFREVVKHGLVWKQKGDVNSKSPKEITSEKGLRKSIDLYLLALGKALERHAQGCDAMMTGAGEGGKAGIGKSNERERELFEKVRKQLPELKSRMLREKSIAKAVLEHFDCYQRKGGKLEDDDVSFSQIKRLMDDLLPEAEEEMIGRRVQL